MAKLTPQQFQEKHARRTKGALQDMKTGIEGVTVAPTQQAAAKLEKMRANFNAKIDDGTVKSRLQAVSLEDWKAQALNKGLGRVSAGVDGSAAKVTDFANQFLPYLDRVASEVDKMPDLTLQDSIQRMVRQVELVAKFRKK